MTYAIVRKDLRQAGEYPNLFTPNIKRPLLMDNSKVFNEKEQEAWNYLGINAIFEAWSPMDIEDRERNYIIRHIISGDLFYVIGCDFDFYETIEQARNALNE